MSERDADLVGRARAGDKEAFAELLTRHQPLLQRVCRRMLGAGTADTLEDVGQEAALQALLGLESLRDPQQFGPWLAGIGLNVARRSLRKNHARDAWSWDALPGGRLVDEPIADGPGPQELAEAAELSTTVRAAVADLPRGQRAAVLLVYLSGLSYRETAAALGVEVGAVRTRLHKGRHRLQLRLRDLLKEDLMTTTHVEQAFVEMRVADVRQPPPTGDRPDRSVVFLEEVGGARQVPIWMGRWEGDAIALLLEKVPVVRPMTYAFMASLLRAGRISVRQVRISRLAEETFYAQAILDGPDGDQAVDARPSDSIALAIQTGTPIYAAEEVIVACESIRAARESWSTIGIGAIDIVKNIQERWPHDRKSVR